MTEPTIETIIAAIREASAQPALYGAGLRRTYQEEALAAACSPANMAKLLEHVDALEAQTGLSGPAIKRIAAYTDEIAALRNERLALVHARDTAIANAAAIQAQADEVAKERDEARTALADANERIGDWVKFREWERDESRREAAGLRRERDILGKSVDALAEQSEKAEAYKAARDAKSDAAASLRAELETVRAKLGFERSKVENRDATIAQLREALTKARPYVADPKFRGIAEIRLLESIDAALAGAAPAAPEPPPKWDFRTLDEKLDDVVKRGVERVQAEADRIAARHLSVDLPDSISATLARGLDRLAKKDATLGYTDVASRAPRDTTEEYDFRPGHRPIVRRDDGSFGVETRHDGRSPDYDPFNPKGEE